MDPTPPTPSRARPGRPPAAWATEALVGREYVALLQGHLDRLRGLYPHPNRVLHYDAVLAALRMGFYNPAVRSLRTTEDQSQCASYRPDLPPGRIARSTLADAPRRMDAKHLLAVVEQLMKQVPALRHGDGDLHALLKRIIALDGSVFAVPADVPWAIALRRSDGQPGRQFRLDPHLDVLRFLPTRLGVSGGDDGSESAAFARDRAGGVVYVADRNFVDFQSVHAVFDAGSDRVVRLKSDTKFVAHEERASSDADRAANVASDRRGRVPGSAGSPGFGERVPREVTLIDPASGKPVRRLTRLLEVEARVLGLIYRHRWMRAGEASRIELFFKWLKCTARRRPPMSESQNGVTVQRYVAVIGVPLTHLRTGRRPSVYAACCLGWVASGQMTPAVMLQVLERRERERERARLARKKAAEKQA